MSTSALAIIVTVGAVAWIVLEGAWSRVQLSNGYKVYTPTLSIRIVLFILIPLFTYGCVENIFQNPHDKWISAILFTVVVGAIYYFPPTVALSRSTIVSVRWLGLKRINMKWQDVGAIYDGLNNSIYVLDKDQRQIEYTIFNIDRSGFISELQHIKALFPHIVFLQRRQD